MNLNDTPGAGPLTAADFSRGGADVVYLPRPQPVQRPGCTSDACAQGRRACPTPQACHVSSADDADSDADSDGGSGLPGPAMALALLGAAVALVSLAVFAVFAIVSLTVAH